LPDQRRAPDRLANPQAFPVLFPESSDKIVHSADK